MNWVGSVAGAVVVLTVTQAVAGGILLQGLSDGPPTPGSFAWTLVSNLLAATMLTLLARRMPLAAARRAGALFLVVFGIPATNLVEVYFFDIGVPRHMLPRLYCMYALVGAAAAAFVGWRAGTSPAPVPRPTRSRLGLAVRLAAGSLAYVVSYFTAGMAVLPVVSDFYAGRAMPDVRHLALIQIFRGLSFTVIAALIVHWTSARPVQAALMAGATLAVLGGVAPLIVPSAYFPTSVRLAHLVEIALSNFFFGLFVGWLLRPCRPRLETSNGSLAA